LCFQGHDDETIKFSQLHGITYEAYSPLGGDDLGGKSVMTYPAVKEIAAAHGVSGAQVALRWVIQQGCALTTATGDIQYMQEDLVSGPQHRMLLVITFIWTIMVSYQVAFF